MYPYDIRGSGLNPRMVRELDRLYETVKDMHLRPMDQPVLNVLGFLRRIPESKYYREPPNRRDDFPREQELRKWMVMVQSAIRTSRTANSIDWWLQPVA